MVYSKLQLNVFLKKALPVSFGIISILLGSLKIYQHIFSVWRFGYLDYLVGAGLILGGLFLILKSTLEVALVSSVFIAFELYKLFLDYNDHWDAFLAILAISYLTITLVKYRQHRITGKVIS